MEFIPTPHEKQEIAKNGNAALPWAKYIIGV